MRHELTATSKAHRQLLPASELTVDHALAERLADPLHLVGELSADGPNREAVRTIETQLRDVGRDTHPDVRAAIGRARTLLTPYSESVD
ncbi:hypothetical protein [Halorientalis regularis]|uniref:Tetratricopeptide repeat-containing protein n=1 Tax=Halorientalis regularis TaxID=660518 RepID=A0A1G7I973_9EURY|nr:hypothetical protein [Halorientalis regularis]SDF09242.1 hypothetical protein SAMN05216218_103325 [Halorientalis regularis]